MYETWTMEMKKDQGKHNVNVDCGLERNEAERSEATKSESPQSTLHEKKSNQEVLEKPVRRKLSAEYKNLSPRGETELGRTKIKFIPFHELIFMDMELRN